MYTYSQTKGVLIDANGKHVATGYSGNGQGKNNSLMQHVKAVGPLPRGWWKIVGPPYDSANVGPYALKLEPMEGTETFGRSAFRLHGDNMTHTASQGCLIFPRAVRKAMWEGSDHEILVVE